MITIVEGRLRWEEHDAERMAAIVGADIAAKGSCAWNPSVLKVAKKKCIKLSPPALDSLRLAREVRYQAEDWKLESPGDVVVPPGFGGFFEHQCVDYSYLKRLPLRGVLQASEPGVGKTAVAIAWAVEILRARRILVVCPNSAKEQWLAEIGRWDPNPLKRPVRMLDGRIEEQIEQAITPYGWVLAHWESLVHARLGLLARSWDVVIADEAHNAQNRNAQRTETLFALEASHRMAITAHPYSSSPDQLFTILKFLYPDIYTSFWAFFYLHVRHRPKPFGGFEILGAKRPKLLQWEIAPFTLRRTKVSLGWAPPTTIRRTVTLTSSGQKEYAKLQKQFFVELAAHEGATKIMAIPSVLARITRLRQYVVDPGLIGARERSVKYPVVEEILNETSQPIVVFTSFEQATGRLAKFLGKKWKLAFIRGRQSRIEQRMTQTMFGAGEYDALIVVTSAGGESLNFGGFGQVVLLDLPWTPRGYEQAVGRVDRPVEGTGVRVQTTAFRVIVANTYEERIERKLEAKHETFGEVFEVGDLKELFK